MSIIDIFNIIGVIILFYIIYRISHWFYIKILHLAHPARPRLRRKLLYQNLKHKYGRGEGKKIFKEIVYYLKHDKGIR